MARNNQLNSSAVGVAVVGGLLFIIGFIMFFSTFIGTARTIDQVGNEIRTGVSGSRVISSSPALGGSSTSGPALFGSSALGSSTLGPSQTRTSPNIVSGAVGAIFMGIGGFLIKVAIGMGLVANAKPIARWVGDVTGHGISRHGQYQAFRSGPTEQPAQKIQVRCKHCTGLNNEDARYCSQCGKEM